MAAPQDVGVIAWGVALPVWRLERAMMAAAWDTPAMPGERTAAAGDQDALSMGVEAALVALGDRPTDDVDAIFFATTTPPYAEKGSAATIATVLGRDDASTTDITGSLRAGTAAIRSALDAVRAGRARTALVVAGDTRPAEPASGMEQLFGDGAAALLIGPDAAAPVVGDASTTEEYVGPWRRTGDPWVRSFDAKMESDRFRASTVDAARAALRATDTSPDAISSFAAYAPDPRSFAGAAKAIGLAQAKDTLFTSAGNLGAAHAVVALAGALDTAEPGDQILVTSAGEGADAFVVTARVGVDAARPARTLADALARKRILPSYERYLRFRRLLAWDDPDTPSSTIRTWRDRAQAFRMQGVRCTACGVTQFPANRACIACSELDEMEPVALQRRGTVFTFTLDHLIAGEYLETPVARAVIDLDGGGRIFAEVTDCDPSDVHVGMRVELTFRLIHEGADFKNYYWKARPDAGDQG